MAGKKKLPSINLIELNAREAAKKAYQLRRFPVHKDPREINKWRAKAHKYYTQLERYFEDRPLGKKKAETYRAKAREYAPESSSGLVQRLSPVISIMFLASALILVSFNLTGYTVNEAENITRWAGVACFLCGLVFSFIHIRARK